MKQPSYLFLDNPQGVLLLWKHTSQVLFKSGGARKLLRVLIDESDIM